MGHKQADEKKAESNLQNTQSLTCRRICFVGVGVVIKTGESRKLLHYTRTRFDGDFSLVADGLIGKSRLRDERDGDGEVGDGIDEDDLAFLSSWSSCGVEAATRMPMARLSMHSSPRTAMPAFLNRGGLDWKKGTSDVGGIFSWFSSFSDEQNASLTDLSVGSKFIILGNAEGSSSSVGS